LQQLNFASVYFFVTLFSTLFVLVINIPRENRRHIVAAWPDFRRSFGWFFLNEFMQAMGVWCGLIALAAIPMTVLSGIMQFQPIYVLALGAIVAYVTGQKGNENLGKKAVFIKLACFAVMILGAMLLV
jgi:hypothetical protein